MNGVAYFTQAMIVGLLLSVPIGPISMLCIKTTLQHGFYGAILVGLGIAIADMFFAVLAVCGLYSVADILIAYTEYIKFGGGLFLLYLGYREWHSTKRPNFDFANKANMVSKVFLTTITNPMLILMMMGVLASINLVANTLPECGMIILGVAAGSMAWWCLLGSIVVAVRRKFSKAVIDKLHYVSSLVFVACGVWAIVSACLNLLG